MTRAVSCLASLLVLVALVPGCAGAAPVADHWPTPPQADPGEVHFHGWVWKPRTHATARANATCAQSIVYATQTKGYRWGEAIVIEAHSDHWIAGQAKIDLGGRISTTFFTSEHHPSMLASDVGDDRRCKSDASIAVLTPQPTATAGGSVTQGPSGSGATTTTSSSSIAIDLDATPLTDPRPAVQLFRHDMQHDAAWGGSLDQPPVAAGVSLRIELWGMSAIDWTGVTFEVRTYEIVPEDEAAYRKEVEAKREAFLHPKDLRPHIEECRSKISAPECADVHASVCQLDPAILASADCAELRASMERSASQGEITNTPPPPALAETQPPKPSVHATWVGGHWVFVRGTWSFWSAGFWRVDDDDRTTGQTVTAPSAPPTPKVEPQVQAPPPAPGAVWTAGYWHWSAGWTWVGGAWRVPPTPTVVWRPATWRVDVQIKGSFRLDPGGWLPR